MTDTSAEAVAKYLIRKHGGYYRPNSRGYTESPILAGRYTLSEAINETHPNGPSGPRDGMSYIHEDDLIDEAWLAHRTAILAMRAERDAARELVPALSRDLEAMRARAEQAEADRDASLECVALEATARAKAEARVAELDADKIGLCDQIGKLLGILDDWDKERADEFNGGLTMHTYGQSPDWYVEAAFWSCFGFAPTDARAALSQEGGE